MAVGPARVGVVPASHGHKLPAVKPRSQLQLKHTGGVDLLGLHTWLVRTFLSPARSTTCANYELADASCRRTFATGSYAGEALVAMGMSIEDHIGVMVVKDVPEGLYLGAIVGVTGSIERVLEIGKSAPRWVVGEVCAEPAPLG